MAKIASLSSSVPKMTPKVSKSAMTVPGGGAKGGGKKMFLTDASKTGKKPDLGTGKFDARKPKPKAL